MVGTPNTADIPDKTDSTNATDTTDTTNATNTPNTPNIIDAVDGPARFRRRLSEQIARSVGYGHTHRCAPMETLIDLSHTIRPGLVTFKGLPPPIICDYLTREASRANYTDGTEFQIGRIDMVANTGTYIDVPFHRYADGKDLAQTDLHRFVDLPAVVRVDHRERLEIAASDFDSVDVKGRAVLVHTGWSAHWGTERYFDHHPFLTREAAQTLLERGAALVGIDSHNIDDTRTRNSRPVHTILLRHEILIVEHLCRLEQVPDGEFTFSAVPPKVHGMGTFPVRAYARQPA